MNNDLKILVVDDDPSILDITFRILKEKGYSVNTCINGQECLDAIQIERPDIILLDVILPDFSGPEVCKTIKSDPDFASVYIFLLSGLRTQSDNIADGLEFGADGYLLKPLKNRELLAHVAAAARIITAERNLRLQNIELQRINAEKDKFFSIIAHDLKSPFNTFLGFTKIMVEDLVKLNPDDLKNMALSMQKSASNLFRLLENLLEWSQFQKGLSDFNPTDLYLKSFFTENESSIIDAARIKEIGITVNIPDDIVLFADKEMLGSIFRNLVLNAVKFTKRGGKINISAIVNNVQEVEITVQDTGIGMDQTLLDNLFHIDSKTGRKGTEGELSTGLGLLLCKDFIEKHGGKLWIEVR